MIDRMTFFAAIRNNPFGGHLSRSQVTGTDAILDAWEGSGLADLRLLAYMLATAFHETARTMLPITERGARGYFRKYEPSTKVGQTLGNTHPGDGYLFRGRGYVQCTGRRNYERMGQRLGIRLLDEPDMALEQDIAARIMFEGMTHGLFTGKKLVDYFDGQHSDWRNARRIINGTDRAGDIAIYAQAFHAALT